MLAILGLVIVALVAVGILSFFVHLLFSPFLLLVAVGIVAWMKLGPRRSHR